ncbi:DUF1173 family protein [Kutzneria sp. 744]|uniref:DUF1173 family protein n=1 Tax=Kutzneria sp. (strain 744) TaxID=345341 RepID=UPI0004B71B85|nr:DUF1173 family protein [Kutzneria sp. 744]
MAGRVLPAAALRTYPERYAHLLAAARAEVGHAECLCRPGRPLRLVIRRRVGRLHLAGWPNDGHNHAPSCLWYRADPELSGRAGYERDGAIDNTNDGIRLRLAVPLTTRTDPADRTPAHLHALGEQAVSQRGLGLLGLVHFLWEPELAVHSSITRRRWRDCQPALVDQVAQCSTKGFPLPEVLHVIPPYRKERPDETAGNRAAWQAFLRQLDTVGPVRRHALVLGELRDIVPARFSMRVQFAHLPDAAYASPELIERVQNSYRVAFTDEHSRNSGRRIALCVISRSPKGYLRVDDMAVMPTNFAYIPVDSSYELTMADALISAGRVFIKPLRYDPDLMATLPDFVLIDTDPPTYVEVWGVLGREDYEQRKAEKRDYYRKSGHALLEWDVRRPMPDVHRTD